MMSGNQGGLQGAVTRDTPNMSVAAQMDTLPPPASPADMPVAFATFASMTGPQPVRDARGNVVSVIAGNENEIWLKYIKMCHGDEKHTPSEWLNLISEYSGQPAHPSGMIE
jgi:hypothetical protein